MKYLQNLSYAFVSGVIGAAALMLAATLYQGVPDGYVAFKQRLYRLLVWGGIWALLLVIPVCKNKWFVRGIIISFIVIIFNFTVLMPLMGKGFFAAQGGKALFWGNIVFNAIWGIIAAAWYQGVYRK